VVGVDVGKVFQRVVHKPLEVDGGGVSGVVRSHGDGGSLEGDELHSLQGMEVTTDGLSVMNCAPSHQLTEEDRGLTLADDLARHLRQGQAGAHRLWVVDVERLKLVGRDVDVFVFINGALPEDLSDSSPQSDSLNCESIKRQGPDVEEPPQLLQVLLAGHSALQEHHLSDVGLSVKEQFSTYLFRPYSAD
jgi:hypothetical protein